MYCLNIESALSLGQQCIVQIQLTRNAVCFRCLYFPCLMDTVTEKQRSLQRFWSTCSMCAAGSRHRMFRARILLRWERNSSVVIRVWRPGGRKQTNVTARSTEVHTVLSFLLVTSPTQGKPTLGGGSVDDFESGKPSSTPNDYAVSIWYHLEGKHARIWCRNECTGVSVTGTSLMSCNNGQGGYLTLLT